MEKLEIVERTLKVLKEVEWKGSEIFFICPWCGVSEAHGHEKDCELEKLIEDLGDLV